MQSDALLLLLLLLLSLIVRRCHNTMALELRWKARSYDDCVLCFRASGLVIQIFSR